MAELLRALLACDTGLRIETKRYITHMKRRKSARGYPVGLNPRLACEVRR